MKPSVRFRTHLSTALLFILGYICPFNSLGQAPANDACGSAQTIISGTSCTATAGTLRTATGSMHSVVMLPRLMCGIHS
jgi:hypothetical protein